MFKDFHDLSYWLPHTFWSTKADLSQLPLAAPTSVLSASLRWASPTPHQGAPVVSPFLRKPVPIPNPGNFSKISLGLNSAFPLEIPLYILFFGHTTWHVELPRPGIKPVSLAVESRVLTTRPPGKPYIFFLTVFYCTFVHLSLLKMYLF